MEEGQSRGITGKRQHRKRSKRGASYNTARRAKYEPITTLEESQRRKRLKRVAGDNIARKAKEAQATTLEEGHEMG